MLGLGCWPIRLVLVGIVLLELIGDKELELEFFVLPSRSLRRKKYKSSFLALAQFFPLAFVKRG